jgi:hypothetical protein
MNKFNLLAFTFFYAAFAWASNPETTVFRQGSDGTTVLVQQGTDFGFFMPETGGYLKTGLILGAKSL